MRLDRLDLTRYGHFTDRRLAFPAPAPGEADLHVVYGPNEAGKSTLFSAWLDLLFGIPLRTRYDFRHPGPTMRVGARLSHAGGALDLARVKRNTGSLLDAHDQPVPEALLQSALGGLTREGYSAMFSLDDDTLEKGGDSILASRGDLGEMLFSASAGLAQLSPRLEAIRVNLDGFHRSGKRSGWLWDTKKRLTELDAERRRLDVSAGTIQKLAREAEAAEAAWRAARGAEDAAQADLGRLQDLAATLPIRARLEGLRARLAPLAHLPKPGWPSATGSTNSTARPKRCARVAPTGPAALRISRQRPMPCRSIRRCWLPPATSRRPRRCAPSTRRRRRTCPAAKPRRSRPAPR